MADPFLGEIRILPFDFAPQGWAACNGQLLSISQNPALFSILGTTYGGDGRTNFALPNFQGSAPLDAGQGNGLSLRNPGDKGGVASVTPLAAQMPAHSHAAQGSSNGGDQNSPANGVWSIPSAGRGLNVYDPGAGSSPAMNAKALSSVGGNQAHDNMMPYLTLNLCIALVGIFPQRS
jgi:microcystin-dependent protein